MIVRGENEFSLKILRKYDFNQTNQFVRKDKIPLTRKKQTLITPYKLSHSLMTIHPQQQI